MGLMFSLGRGEGDAERHDVNSPNRKNAGAERLLECERPSYLLILVSTSAELCLWDKRSHS